MRYIKLASLIILLALVIKFAGAIGMALEAGKVYIEDRFNGASHQIAMCALGEWSDNMARYFGFTGNDADVFQELYFGYWCGDLASELSENTPVVPLCESDAFLVINGKCYDQRTLA